MEQPMYKRVLIKISGEPLAGDKQRVAMHRVSRETLFWETMEKLKALGASSILVLPIEKMME